MADMGKVFSEFFLDQVGIKVGDDNATVLVDCVGSLEEETTMKTITKSCRGRVKKSRTKPESGSITITFHCPYYLLKEIYGESVFAEGVYGYGTTSMHQQCIITAKVLDEDDKVQYRAYPCAVATSRTITIDDDATEVAMVEMSMDTTPDENEVIVYTALEEDVDPEIAGQWMSNFSTALITPAA